MFTSDPADLRRDARNQRNKLRRIWRRRRNHRRMWAFFFIIVPFGAFLALLSTVPSAPVSTVESVTSDEAPVPPLPGGNLEARLGGIASSFPGEYGVAVFDPRTGKTFEVSAGREFEAASLAKLPVLLALYSEAAAGDLSLDDGISMYSSDVQAYGSGSLYMEHPVGHRMTLRECARVMIKESDNTAWVMLERHLGKERISRELELLGASDFDYAKYRATPEDVMLVLKAISNPSYTTPELSSEMLESMTDTKYEDRIPEPLPETIEVAHKVGSLDDTFSDAGMVFDGGKRDPEYFIVVIGSGADEDDARDAIQSISLATYRTLKSQREEN